MCICLHLMRKNAGKDSANERKALGNPQDFHKSRPARHLCFLQDKPATKKET